LEDATVKYQKYPEDNPVGAEVGAVVAVDPDVFEVPL
jgi:hypothetical protein